VLIVTKHAVFYFLFLVLSFFFLFRLPTNKRDRTETFNTVRKMVAVRSPLLFFGNLTYFTGQTSPAMASNIL